jgi:hypothetical protein
MNPTRYAVIVFGTVAALSLLAGAYAASEFGRYTRVGYASCAFIGKKLDLAGRITEPKLVVVGGSNAEAGVEVGKIAGRFGVKGFNFALVATFSPGFQLFEAEKIVRPGDAVLLTFEYLAYDYQTPTGGLIDAVYSCSTDYWRSLDWGEKLFFVFALRPQRFVDTLRFDRATIARVQATLAGQLATNGDLLEPPTPAPDIGSHQPLAIHLREGSSGAQAIARFVAWAKANNVTVLATWPNTLDFSEYRSDPAFVAIKEFYRSLGVPVIGEPQDAMFAPGLLADTVYHLTKGGMDIRTEKLAERLATEPAFAAWAAKARQ